MSSSAISTQVAQLKIGNVQNQADTSAVYNGGIWSFKNSTAATAVTITNAGNVGISTTNPSAKLHVDAGYDNAAIFKNLYTFGGANYAIAIQGDTSVRGYIAQNPAAGGLLLSSGSTYYGGGPYRSDGTAACHMSLVSDGAISFATNSGLTAGSNFTPTERMRITASGAFSFQSTTQTSDKAFLIKNFGETGNGRNSVTLDSGNAGSNSSIIAFNKNNGNLWNLFNDTPANNSTDFAIWSSSTGGVTLGSNTATSWSPRSSDERKKKNFETTQGLEEVLQIEPVKYHFKSEEDSAPKRLGFKAQNLQTVVPEMVFSTGEKAEDGSDYLTITPDYLLPVLVKAIQELSAKVDAQDREIRRLKGEAVEEPVAPAPVIEPAPAPAVEQPVPQPEAQSQSVLQPEPEIQPEPTVQSEPEVQSQSAPQPAPEPEVQPVSEPESP